MLGHDLIDVQGDTANVEEEDDEDKSLLDKVSDKWDDVKDDVKETVNDVTGNIADKLADTLGISEWYSIHVMEACEGEYKPNATYPGAGLNVTNCTDSSPGKRFNLSEMIDHELEVGPFSLNLADINWPDEIDDALDTINAALLALFIVYVLGIGFSGLGMLTCILAFFLFTRRGINALNLVLATLAAISLTVGSIVATIASSKGVNKINEFGDDVGISAHAGTKFLGISWAASGVMIVAMIYWVVNMCMARRERKREWKPRKGSY